MSRAAPALLAAVALALAGCGGSHDAGKLAWTKPPTIFTPKGLANDRIAVGQIRNGSSDLVEVRSDSVRVVDAKGRPLKTDARYAAGFAHDLYGFYTGGPKDIGISERVRLGRFVPLAPGDVKPLTVAWRERRGARGVRVELGPATLPLR